MHSKKKNRQLFIMSSCEEFGFEAQLQCSFLERPRAVVFCHEAGLKKIRACDFYRTSAGDQRDQKSIPSTALNFAATHNSLDPFRIFQKVLKDDWKPFFLILSESFNVFWQVLLVLTSRQNQPGKSGSAWTAQRGSPTWEPWCDSGRHMSSWCDAMGFRLNGCPFYHCK